MRPPSWASVCWGSCLFLLAACGDGAPGKAGAGAHHPAGPAADPARAGRRPAARGAAPAGLPRVRAVAVVSAAARPPEPAGRPP